MNIVQSSVIAIAIGFCLLSALLARRLFFRLSLDYFGVYLILKAVTFGLEWLLVHPDSAYKALWLGLLMASSFLMAPCLWLFALETAANSRPSLQRLSGGERGLIVIGALLTVPLILSAHEGGLMVDPDYPATGPAGRIIHETMLSSIALLLVQVPYYLWKCLRVVRAHKRRSMALFSNIDDMQLNALTVLMWVMAGNWGINLLRTLRALTMHDSQALNLIFSSVDAGMIVWALCVILRRNPPFDPDERKLFDGKETEGAARETAAKYLRSSLTDPLRERIMLKLEKAMAGERLYMKSNLKLRDLCDHIGEKMHYVSQVINQHMNTTFYEMVNRHRVRAATELLAGSPHKTILDIALEVGFNSKTTFNSCFKRTTAMTPSQFRDSRARGQV